jgi:hypothetical protein
VSTLSGKAYTYPVEVEVSTSIRMIVANMDTTPRLRSFTRIFTCADSGAKFQATIRLNETPSQRITGVTVGPPHV